MTAAGDDEIARVYLRGRDAPCPKCGYNRRDGREAACPECGHALTLAPGGLQAARAGRVAAGWLFGSMLAMGVPGTALVVILALLSRSWGVSAEDIVIFTTLGALFALPMACGFWGYRVTRRRLRSGEVNAADVRRIRTAGIVMVAATVLLYAVTFLSPGF
ncbi:MAG: hypothetical protein DHS20C14_18340 [Phycisphaeraceae bacterium]|nr:MAG: hypothetical protein DHS20C14_18340 [Phycisphaeraceae bacterium]